MVQVFPIGGHRNILNNLSADDVLLAFFVAEVPHQVAARFPVQAGPRVPRTAFFNFASNADDLIAVHCYLFHDVAALAVLSVNIDNSFDRVGLGTVIAILAGVKL